ncbi:MAG: Rne/Rng family ribonuclease, partial [Jatrophihabitantaceae bacterium]
MLEPDNTNTESTATSAATTADEDAARPAKAPRKRAAKKAPAAAANDTSAAATNDASPPPADAALAVSAPRKRAAKKAPAKAPDTDTGTAEIAAKATRPARKGARKATPAAPAEAGQPTVEQAAVEPAAKTPRKRASKKSATTADGRAPEDGRAPALAAPAGAPSVLFVAPDETASQKSATEERKAPAKRGRRGAQAPAGPPVTDEPVPGATDLATVEDVEDKTADPDDVKEAAVEEATGARRRRRRGRRGRGGARPAGEDTENESSDESAAAEDTEEPDEAEASESTEAGESTATRRRRRRRRAAGANGDAADEDDPPNTVVHVREAREKSNDDGVKGVKGSTRLEAKRQRRRDGRDTSRRRPPILTESEFLARREAVDRVMAVRQSGERTQIAVLEDGILVEHYVTRASATSYVGNVYLGRVQNVLPSMEAAFVDISKGRNGVLYAGEVNWDAAGLEGKSRAIENALKSGDSVLVQVTKDPIGHKGARLTSQISLPGRFLVYVPGGGMTGISRKLPDTERHRLKAILKKIVPEDAGVIIRTAAEGASEEDLTRDVERLKSQWEAISAKAKNTKSAPTLVHGEPDLAIRVVRDVFNEDFKQLVVQGEGAWDTVSEYLGGVAPDLAERASRHVGNGDLFHDLRVDEQLMKALDRKVWLPSGGSLVIDRTEAMTVIDVNTGKFVGTGGNLEQTVTRNNLEAAEEIVRQLRLRDVGGIVVIDFIDMVLESNRELVLRRLTECLGRDRTKHQVAEVTSLGLVQMTRKRVGEGLLEAFSQTCTVCNGRGVIIHTEPVDKPSGGSPDADEERPKGKRKRGSGAAKKSAEPVDEPAEDPAVREKRLAAMAAIHKAAHPDEDLPAELQIEAVAAVLDAEPVDLDEFVTATGTAAVASGVFGADSTFAEPAASDAALDEPPAPDESTAALDEPPAPAAAPDVLAEP